MDNSNNQENELNLNSQEVLDKAKKDGSDKVQEIAKDAASKGARKVSKNVIKNQVSSKVLTALLPYITVALVFILVAIIIIGILAFFLTLPGMMGQKITEIFEDLSKSIQSIYKGEVDASITNKEVIELANYIENMDYDLIGYGFVRPNLDSSVKTVEQLSKDGYEDIKQENPDKDKDGEPEYLIFLEDEKGNRYNKNFY